MTELSIFFGKEYFLVYDVDLIKLGLFPKLLSDCDCHYSKVCVFSYVPSSMLSTEYVLNEQFLKWV